VNAPPRWNWWKWTLIAAAVIAVVAAAGGAVGWAVAGPGAAAEVAAYVCGLGLPAALVIEAVAARKAGPTGPPNPN
jgi:hypothetical protein